MALLESTLKKDGTKVIIACTINLLAVSTVFMTQSIFLELSESFRIDLTQARLSFSIVSLFHAVSFFSSGLPPISLICLRLL
jgi:YNFM family putative membrane transporter